MIAGTVLLVVASLLPAWTTAQNIQMLATPYLRSIRSWLNTGAQQEEAVYSETRPSCWMVPPQCPRDQRHDRELLVMDRGQRLDDEWH